MRRDQAVADIALGSAALGTLFNSVLPGLSVPLLGVAAVGSAIGLTAIRHWLLAAPFSLAILTNIGLWSLSLTGLPAAAYSLAAALLLVLSFALTPSFKALGRFQEAWLEGEESKDPRSDIVERIYKVAKQNGGISSLAYTFQEINQPEMGKPVSLKECGRALKDLQDLGEAYKLSAEGNVFLFPGITALNDPLSKSIVELAIPAGTVTVHDLILRLNLTPEVAQTALSRLEQFGIAVSKVEDGLRFYTIKGLAKHYPYTERTRNNDTEDEILA